MVHGDFIATYDRIISRGNKPDALAEAIEKLCDWAEVIIQITAIMRYVKFKHLTMYVASMMVHATASQRGDDSSDVFAVDQSKFQEFMSRIFDRIKRNNGDMGFTRSANIAEVFESSFPGLYNDFVNGRGQPGGDGTIDPLQRDLNLMPDASPSTLFGEDWLENLFVRWYQRTPGRADPDDGSGKGLSHEGVFGEAEQWLWATHEMIVTAYKLLSDQLREASESQGTGAATTAAGASGTRAATGERRSGPPNRRTRSGET